MRASINILATAASAWLLFSLLAGTAHGGGAGAPASRPSSKEAIFDASDSESVIFILPENGAMMATLDELRRGVHRSVSLMRASQRFNVVLVTGDRPRALAAAPLAASPENRRKLGDFLDKAGGHNGDYLPALRFALAQHPRRLFLVMNGGTLPQAEISAEIRRFNAARQPADRVQVHAVAWYERDPDGYEKWLRELTAEHGGAFRFVGEERGKK